jgi:pimeloyl-ACP methyl ester carboxylesterase
MRAMIGWSVTEKLGSIKCPTLIIAADQDYTPVALKEAYAKLIPNAQLVVIPDSRHATPVEQPEKFNNVLMEFLAKQN